MPYSGIGGQYISRLKVPSELSRHSLADGCVGCPTTSTTAAPAARKRQISTAARAGTNPAKLGSHDPTSWSRLTTGCPEQPSWLKTPARTSLEYTEGLLCNPFGVGR